MRQPVYKLIGGFRDRMPVYSMCGGDASNMNMLLAMPNAIHMETSGPQRNMVNGEVPGPNEPEMSTEPRRRTA